MHGFLTYGLVRDSFQRLLLLLLSPLLLCLLPTFLPTYLKIAFNVEHLMWHTDMLIYTDICLFLSGRSAHYDDDEEEEKRKKRGREGMERMAE